MTTFEQPPDHSPPGDPPPGDPTQGDPAPVRGGSPLDTLRRISRNRPTPPVGERCEMCSQPVDDGHSHVVDLHSRSLMCTCRACYLLFTDSQAVLRYRAVPERYLRFPDLTLTDTDGEELQIPVGLVFLFRNSVQNRVVAFYPGPAGATESELPLQAWDALVAAHPQLGLLAPDVEALLVDHRPGQETTCHLLPIDACYELVGTMRRTWRGFDGGQEARAAMADFFARVDRRSRPAPSVAGGAG